MKNSDDLKAIWHSAKTDNLPDSDVMLRTIKKFRSQKLRNKWMVIVSSCLLSGLIIAVLFIVHFKLLTTYIGGGLMAASGTLLAITNIRSLKRFYLLDDDSSNVEFLAFIEQTRQNQIYYYKKTQTAVMLLCSVGLLLYLYEPTLGHPLWFTGIYGLSLAYLLVMWFVVRPRYYKKGIEKLNATLHRLKSISKQLK